MWFCTGSEQTTRKRCPAVVVTNMIDGYAMLSVCNQNHICTKPTEKSAK